MAIWIGVIVILFTGILFLNKKLMDANRENERITLFYNVFLKEYIALVRIDLKDDTYELIKINESIQKLLQQTKSQATFQMKNVMKAVVKDEHLEEMLEFVDFPTLPERMKKVKKISFDFYGRFNGWCRAKLTWEDKENQIVLFSVVEIEDDKSKETKLRYLTENDMLSGLHNEKFGVERLKKHLALGDQGMFALVEVDHFKEINDEYGSLIGDKVIVEVANCIIECSKEDDILIRRGGARFAIFANSIPDKQDGRFIMKMLENRIGVIDIEGLKISVSSGVAFYRPEEEITYEELLKRAESCISISRAQEGVSVSYYD